MVHGLAQGVGVAPMQAHGGVRVVATLLQQPEGAVYGLLGPVEPAQPVVPAHAALGQLVDDAEQLLGGRVAELGVRRAHHAVLVAIVAPAGDVPVRTRLVQAGKLAVHLARPKECRAGDSDASTSS